MSKQIIALYTAGHGGPYIAKQLNIKLHTVYKTLRDHNIPIKSHREKSLKYSVNESYFDEIATEDQAYWLGFMAADGYQTGKVIGCSLSIKDQAHLESLRLALSATHPVKVYTQTQGYAPGTQYARLLITSPRLCIGLAQNNVIQNKTKILTFPKLLKPLRRHFIRGYFDGDGCWSKSTKSASGFTMKICGTKKLLKSIAVEMGVPIKHVYTHKSIYSLEKSGKDVLRLMNYLYQDSTIALQRKKDRWYVAQSLLAEKLVE